jgi:NADH-quinone oxidoreductase subunit A
MMNEETGSKAAQSHTKARSDSGFVIRDQASKPGDSAGIIRYLPAFWDGLPRACREAGVASGGREALIIPIFTSAVPGIIMLANYSDAIYFIDPHPFSLEIINYDHDVFGAERRCLSMDDVLSGDLIYVFAFLLAGLVFAGGPFVVVHLLAARKTRNYANKTDQYIECGMEPIGDAWIRYSAVYYLYALVFVAFAVDVLFLIPVALVYNRIPEFVSRDFVEMFIFVGILSLVIVYAWKKGVFEWKRKMTVPKP